MTQLLSLALLIGAIAASSPSLAAQAQTQTPAPAQPQTGGGELKGEILQANGRIHGTITSSTTGRPIAKMTVHVRDVGAGTGGKVISKETDKSGDFNFPDVPLGAYVLECVDGNKVLGTASVQLSKPAEAVDKDMSCTTDVAFWKTKKGGSLTGLAAAVLAVGGTAIVTKGDASPAR